MLITLKRQARSDRGKAKCESYPSAYHLNGKPGNTGQNSNGTVHPGGNFPEKK